MYVYPTKPNEIYHYGMPRRSGRYPWGSGDRPYQRITFEQKKQESLNNIHDQPYVKNMKAYLDSIKDPDNTKIQDAYTDLKYERIIKKGDICYRVTSRSDEIEKGATFVSFDKDSLNAYLDEFSYSRRENVKVVQYKLKKDLKIPSFRTMTTEMVNVVMENNDAFNKYVKEYKDRMYKDTIVPKKVMNMVISHPNIQLTRFYSGILRNFSYDVGEMGKELHKRLKDKGYDAVPDLNDVNFQKNRMTPLFIFDRDSSLDKVSMTDSFDDNFNPNNLEFKYDQLYK